MTGQPVELLRPYKRRAFPHYHIPYIPGGWIVVNEQYREYVAPSMLGPIDHSLDHEMAREFDWPHVLHALLLDEPIWTPKETPKFCGRWFGSKIGIVREAPGTGWRQIFDTFRDISLVLLEGMDHLQRRHPKPKNFRKLLNLWRTGLLNSKGPGDAIPEDYLWVRPHHVRNIEIQCNYMRTPQTFWDRFHKWLRRQKITDELRRHMGGRPGALKEVQDKKLRQRRPARALRIRSQELTDGG